MCESQITHICFMLNINYAVKKKSYHFSHNSITRTEFINFIYHEILYNHERAFAKLKKLLYMASNRSTSPLLPSPSAMPDIERFQGPANFKHLISGTMFEASILSAVGECDEKDRGEERIGTKASSSCQLLSSTKTATLNDTNPAATTPTVSNTSNQPDANIHTPSIEEINQRSYFIYLRRQQEGRKGDSASDWIQAKLELYKERCLHIDI